jgi:hypothetical protein
VIVAFRGRASHPTGVKPCGTLLKRKPTVQTMRM